MVLIALRGPSKLLRAGAMPKPTAMVALVTVKRADITLPRFLLADASRSAVLFATE